MAEPSVSTSAGPSAPDATTIDALRQANAELAAANAQLTDAIRARDAFLAIAAHELRNPMTPMLGRLERLRLLVKKPDVPTDVIERDLERLELLMGDYIRRATTLLDVSRVAMGKPKLSITAVDAGELLHEVADRFRPLAEKAGCDLRLEAPPRPGPMIRADRQALEQVLENLLSNAVKYAEGRWIEVTVTEDIANGVAVLCVSDGGPGISAADQARIFEQFERVVTPGRSGGGFGVGLWLVRQLSEAMGGSVQVASVAGSGSTFRVTLPLYSAEASQ